MINDLGSFFQPRVQGSPPPYAEVLYVPWQYRRAVEWWPDVVANEGEVRLLRRFAEQARGPALEVGFGAGTRLLACRDAGLDIDGVETSRGLYDLCRERFEALGQPRHRLYLQPLHELDLPRRYRSIYAGRVLGTGASREMDALGLYRLFRALQPGGCLIIDHPTPGGDLPRWTAWWAGVRRNWPPALDACEIVSPSGREVLRLSSQPFEHDVETAMLSFSVCARLFEQGELRRTRGVALRQRLYGVREVTDLLRLAGFDERHIAVLPVPGAKRHLWIAEKAWITSGQPASSLGTIGVASALALRAFGGW